MGDGSRLGEFQQGRGEFADPEFPGEGEDEFVLAGTECGGRIGYRAAKVWVGGGGSVEAQQAAEDADTGLA